MKDKYIVLAVLSGVIKKFRFKAHEKAKAVDTYKSIMRRANCDRIKFFSIDSDDETIWYDLSYKYAISI